MAPPHFNGLRWYFQSWNRLCWQILGAYKSQRASKLHDCFKSYGYFAEREALSYWWSCIRKGLRLQACFFGNPYFWKWLHTHLRLNTALPKFIKIYLKLKFIPRDLLLYGWVNIPLVYTQVGISSQCCNPSHTPAGDHSCECLLPGRTVRTSVPHPDKVGTTYLRALSNIFFQLF